MVNPVTSLPRPICSRSLYTPLLIDFRSSNLGFMDEIEIEIEIELNWEKFKDTEIQYELDR